LAVTSRGLSGADPLCAEALEVFCEMLGAIALLIPRLAFWSAIGLFVIMLGAVHAHLTHDEASHLPVVVVALVLLAFVAYVRRGQALFLS